MTTVSLVAALDAALGAEPGSAGAIDWKSCGIIPQWTHVPPSDSKEAFNFAEAIGALISRMNAVCGSCIFHGCDLPIGASAYFPPQHRHLLMLLTQSFKLKHVAGALAKPDSVGNEDLMRKMQSDFSGHNPMLSGVCVLERTMLRKSTLIATNSISQAMDPQWSKYVQQHIEIMLTHLDTLSQWAPLLGLQPKGPEAENLRRMVDEALLHLLKMRPSGRRQGLDVMPHCLEALRGIHNKLEELVPLCHKYLSERGLLRANLSAT